MRVLHIYKDYAPVMGGIENHIGVLARGLRECGIDAQVLVTNTGPQTERLTLDGVPVTKAGRLLSVSSAPVSAAFYPLLYRMEQGVDIAHAHLPYPPGELAQLFLGRSRRFVITYHSDIVRQRVLGRLYRPFLWQVLRRAHLIAVSTPAYLSSSPFLAAFPEKCRVIPFGIELDQLAGAPAVQVEAAELRARFGERPLLLFVGRLRHYKGLHVLLDAMHQVDAHLLVIGSGPMGEVWQRKAATEGLNGKVTFWGERPDRDKLAAYHAADLFVLPSTNRAEAFGLVLVEAMACGLPVISTELGTGTSFVNQHEQTGLVVPANDAPALAAAINRLLADEPLRRTLGQAAHARAHAVFSKAAMLTRTIAFYQEALSR
ncbi:MAG TPA: glycosyltransferase [Caldilineaceae bacterium]|nr:glycosyltransferase [Caldilineaceae bacterium]